MIKKTYELPEPSNKKENAMPIIMIENQYPVKQNKEVLAAWLSALEKYPRPEGLFEPLVETAVNSDLNGRKSCDIHVICNWVQP